MISEYYFNGKRVGSVLYFHGQKDGIYEHYTDKYIYSYIFIKNRYFCSLEEIEEKKLLFLVKFGMSFEQWCEKNGYKTKGGK